MVKTVIFFLNTMYNIFQKPIYSVVFISLLQVLEEAQEIAVRDHNVEFKSNLWVGKYALSILLK